MSESASGLSEDVVKVVYGTTACTLAICVFVIFWRPARAVELTLAALGSLLYFFGLGVVAFRQLRRQLDRIESKLDSLSRSR